ncbi:hypothetical protein [Xanthomonas sp. MWU16-30325]|uniref:hypothetical protein n=1 Tax=Xanthomonas sp. MWU16-30325 TaxID=2878096 RepID=UPI001CF8F6A7|nr:hypothetical protein [Xanthomonas sp. MWU16-30325]
MRVGYFGYHVKSRVDNVEYLVDLRRFFRSFANSDVAFKSQFKYGGETLLLQVLELESNTYLFVQSRDLELIKRIQKSNLSAQDISSMLGSGDGVGFASYVVVGDCWISFACRVLSPRHTAFGNMANELFQKFSINYDFIFTALQSELQPELVPRLEKVGKIDIEINASSPLWQRACDLFTGGDGQEIVDASELHVSFIPKRKKKASLGKALNEMINELPRDGLESIKARAKLEEKDRMSDMYIYGQGALRDYVFPQDELHVASELARARQSNNKFAELIGEFRDEQRFQSSSATDLGINWSRASRSRLVDD